VEGLTALDNKLTLDVKPTITRRTKSDRLAGRPGCMNVARGYTRFYWPEHPLAASSLGWVRENGLVGWQITGFSDWFLEAYKAGDIAMHHIDGDKDNDDPSNFQILLRGSTLAPPDHPAFISENDAALYLFALGWKIEAPASPQKGAE